MYTRRDKYLSLYYVHQSPAAPQTHFNYQFADGKTVPMMLWETEFGARHLSLWDGKSWVPIHDWFPCINSAGWFQIWAAHHEMIKARDNLPF